MIVARVGGARGVRLEGLAGDESGNCARGAPTRQCSGEENGIPIWPLLPAHRIVTDLMRDIEAKPGGAREIPFLVLGEFWRVGRLLEHLLGRPCSAQILRAKVRGNRFGRRVSGSPDPWTGDFVFLLRTALTNAI